MNNYTEEKLKRMKLCLHFLPAPGDEVVACLIAEVERLKEDNAMLRKCLDDLETGEN